MALSKSMGKLEWVISQLLDWILRGSPAWLVNLKHFQGFSTCNCGDHMQGVEFGGGGEGSWA